MSFLGSPPEFPQTELSGSKNVPPDLDDKENLAQTSGFRVRSNEYPVVADVDEKIQHQAYPKQLNEGSAWSQPIYHDSSAVETDHANSFMGWSDYGDEANASPTYVDPRTVAEELNLALSSLRNTDTAINGHDDYIVIPNSSSTADTEEKSTHEADGSAATEIRSDDDSNTSTRGYTGAYNGVELEDHKSSGTTASGDPDESFMEDSTAMEPSNYGDDTLASIGMGKDELCDSVITTLPSKPYQSQDQMEGCQGTGSGTSTSQHETPNSPAPVLETDRETYRSIEGDKKNAAGDCPTPTKTTPRPALQPRWTRLAPLLSDWDDMSIYED
ncbi:hypothetical protein JX265_003452 [Neoarthrinium moseri]|uniref:Uncharacterized protein n=1 Tax=Neoarthrinium moseri TaxID=1658444 RepID=A0A9Q0ATI3_9PEZI|nr:hypothetical protein JX266_004458 [Neoarthrinium moseri]KAI1877444.1 hypothetical protein JX265_003452 [Neoarthrinium moseri]